MVIESVESREVELPARPQPSTTLFGVQLRTILGRYNETGPIPAQIEHCLQFVEKNGTLKH
jgi:hypothetical protein